jgi:hypothetical protein
MTRKQPAAERFDRSLQAWKLLCLIAVPTEADALNGRGNIRLVRRLQIA